MKLQTIQDLNHAIIKAGFLGFVEDAGDGTVMFYINAPSYIFFKRFRENIFVKRLSLFKDMINKELTLGVKREFFVI